jgi:phosphate starvation-inducible protein PhoH
MGRNKIKPSGATSQRLEQAASIGKEVTTIRKPTTDLEFNYIGRQNEHRKLIKANDVILCTGPAGTGKTFIAIQTGAELVIDTDSPIKKIVYVRTPTPADGAQEKTIPGDAHAKNSLYIGPVVNTIANLFGESEGKSAETNLRLTGEYTIRGIRFETISTDYLRGKTFDDALIIFDEAASSSQTMIELVIGRKGINSKVVVTGDFHQNDMKEKDSILSGLTHLFKISANFASKFFKLSDETLKPLNEEFERVAQGFAGKKDTPLKAVWDRAKSKKIRGLAIFEYTYADVVRSQNLGSIMNALFER